MTLPRILRHSYPGGDPHEPLAIAQQAEAAGQLRLAATALDRAYGCAPTDERIAAYRRRILDSLAVEEHGLVFRYVPAGVFIRGSQDGDPDERPAHAVFIERDFWLSETTVSWATFNRLLDWPPPPVAPSTSGNGRFLLDLWGEEAGFTLEMAREVRLQYCEDHTRAARDWHAHDPTLMLESFGGRVPAAQLFGMPDRPADLPWRYEDKPMVAVSWQEAEALAATISTPTVRYSLPTEAQWEKAARGGLIGCRYAWGNEPPTPARCDFGRFEPFAIRPSRSFPPNGYGLYAMCGSVWEWTSDYYSSDRSPARGRGPHRVVRGGSWTDPAGVVTVSFRMSRASALSYPTGHVTPNIGFRLCRQARGSGADDAEWMVAPTERPRRGPSRPPPSTKGKSPPG